MAKNVLRSMVRLALPRPLLEYYWEWNFNRTLPDRARVESAQDQRSPLPKDPGIEPTLEASVRWLYRAQDRSISADGGVARHFSLVSGWGESYPETTGYIIPTLLELGRRPDYEEALHRGRRMLDWCVAIQMPTGAFQGGTISAQPVVPTTFNTGQILLGLAAGAGTFETAAYREAMNKAASWLRDTQDEDGCWRRFRSPFTALGEKAYETHVSWGLFEAARISPAAGYGEAGLKQVKWALQKQRSNGWFADCCLDDPTRPLTHTIGYVLRGILEAYRFSNDYAFLEAALRTARPLLGRLDLDGRLAGRFDSEWRPAVSWTCLTGSVQIAYCWLMLFEYTHDRSFLDQARKANSFVRRTVAITGDPDIVGGVKGSFPVGGDYGRYEYLNWAAKFFIDANDYEDRLKTFA